MKLVTFNASILITWRTLLFRFLFGVHKGIFQLLGNKVTQKAWVRYTYKSCILRSSNILFMFVFSLIVQDLKYKRTYYKLKPILDKICFVKSLS